jgi:hypothetical protein
MWLRWLGFAIAIIALGALAFTLWVTVVFFALLYLGLGGDGPPGYNAERIAHAHLMWPWFIGFVVLFSGLILTGFVWWAREITKLLIT